VEQLFVAAQGSSLLFAVLAVVYLGLVVVLAITAAFAPTPTRRKAALDVLRVVWLRRGTSSDHDNGAGANRDASGGDARHPPRPGE
jgi:hypothetical protein